MFPVDLDDGLPPKAAAEEAEALEELERPATVYTCEWEGTWEERRTFVLPTLTPSAQLSNGNWDSKGLPLF